MPKNSKQHRKKKKSKKRRNKPQLPLVTKPPTLVHFEEEKLDNPPKAGTNDGLMITEKCLISATEIIANRGFALLLVIFLTVFISYRYF